MKSKNPIYRPIFPNQDWGRITYKLKDLPILITDEFDFFRCVEFSDSFYGKSVYELNEGNLRFPTYDSRYAELFPGQKLSYWADSIETARKEIKKHGSSNNIITFWSFDDATSTFPILGNDEPLVIINGLDLNFHIILSKVENKQNLTEEEIELINKIIDSNPDCLAYYSVANPGAVNYIFFEKGFRKLAIRQVRLRLGDKKGCNCNIIVCADMNDYISFPKSYGECFLEIAKIGYADSYFKSDDYIKKEKNNRISHDRYNHRINH